MIRSLMVALFVMPMLSVTAQAQSRVSAGLAGGFAVEQVVNRNARTHLRVGLAELQCTATLVETGKAPVLELVSAVVAGQSIRHGGRYTVGLSETFRVNLLPHRDFGPYFETGVGEVSTMMRVPELSGRFQYLLQAGIGARYASGRNRFTVGYRALHLSNNDTMPPNRGLNMHVLVVSYAVVL